MLIDRPHPVKVVPRPRRATHGFASNLQQRIAPHVYGPKPSMRPYAEMLQIDFAVSVDLVGQSGRHSIPQPRRPDHKSLQAEATTCRTPAA